MRLFLIQLPQYIFKNLQIPQWRSSSKLTIFSQYFRGQLKDSTVDLLILISHIHCMYTCVQFVYVHSYSWDIDTYSISTALKTTGNHFPSLRVFAGKAKFWASSCRQNGPRQLAPMGNYNLHSPILYTILKSKLIFFFIFHN